MLFLLKMSLSLNVCKLELNTGYADQKKDSITTQNDLHFTHFAQQIQATPLNNVKKEAVIKHFLPYSSQVIPDF